MIKYVSLGRKLNQWIIEVLEQFSHMYILFLDNFQVSLIFLLHHLPLTENQLSVCDSTNY